MSHKVDCRIRVTDLNVLEFACQEIKYKMHEGSKARIWGNYINGCVRVIDIPGSPRQLGVVPEDQEYRLSYDSMDQHHADKLLVEYQKQVIRHEQAAGSFLIDEEWETEDEYVMVLDV